MIESLLKLSLAFALLLGTPWAGTTFAQEADSGEAAEASDEGGEEASAAGAADQDAKDPPYEPITTVNPQIPPDQLEILVKPLTKSELQGEADAWLELLRKKAKQIAAAQLAVKKTNEAMDAGDGRAAEAAMKAADAVQKKAEAEAEATEKEMSEKAQKQLGLDEAPPTPGDDSADQEDASGDEDAAGETTGEAAGDTEGDAQGGMGAAASAKKEQLLADVSELQDQRTAIADRLEVVLYSLELKGGDVEEYRNYAVAVSGIDLDATDASATWAAITGWLASKEGGQRWLWNIALFLLILLITWIAARVIAAVVNWLLERKVKLSTLAEKLISRTIKDVIMLIGFAIALTALEIDITPILAAIGAAGFIIGFALQGTLSNFASGLMILINRPFDEGDVVNAGGVTGTVNQMNLVSTTFRTFDNQTIHVPNNEIWGSVITNITANDNRRVDMEFGIGYEDDFEEAERIIREVVTQHELVLEDPEPMVVMHELGDSCVKIVCRPWAKTSDWWTVKTEVTRRVKQRFDQAGISIPFPQQDVHLYQHAAETAG
ncbi:mechanosensitive ion channel family protein [Roseiconus nitratireducens]|uniref:Mechanosensitive ion channel family protein n=1 Tax=Roseiconus nitratireducens TaxID=2605748 RepID=A0A5M6D0G3_9BACT|nr:mechanosensitive ion channel family protein [Roseiconus nitratireducens]KAA5539069.1 mechanosensitive ion channel family protein [Roseiconus nitratireducens]